MELRVITLNAWGLWVVAKRRQERVAALAQFLRRQASVHLIDSCLYARYVCTSWNQQMEGSSAALQTVPAQHHAPHAAAVPHEAAPPAPPDVMLLAAPPAPPT